MGAAMWAVVLLLLVARVIIGCSRRPRNTVGPPVEEARGMGFTGAL